MEVVQNCVQERDLEQLEPYVTIQSNSDSLIHCLGMFVETNICDFRLISYQAFFIQDTGRGNPMEGRVDLRYFQHKFVKNLKHIQVFCIGCPQATGQRGIAIVFTRDFP
jgi:hypothetical protein